MTTGPAAGYDIITLDEAAGRIAERLKARDSWAVVIPPAAFSIAVRRIGKLFGAVVYADNGGATAIAVSTPAAAAELVESTDAVGMLSTMVGADYIATGVAIVPKTVPHGLFQRTLGQKIPTNSAQDILLIQNPLGEPFRQAWPTLFLNACELFDPGSTVEIRAQGTPVLRAAGVTP